MTMKNAKVDAETKKIPRLHPFCVAQNIFKYSFIYDKTKQKTFQKILPKYKLKAIFSKAKENCCTSHKILWAMLELQRYNIVFHREKGIIVARL